MISIAEQEQKFDQLVKYLLMCRNKLKDVNIDSSLAYSYAKLNRNAELESLIQGSNSVDFQRVGDRCFDSQLYEAAKVLFVALNNNAKIASCLVRLKQFNKAIESAQKVMAGREWE